jgi:hypothetical protein
VLLLDAGVAGTKVAVATDNFTTATTWDVVDTVGYIDSEAGTQAIGVANIDSPTFTWGAGAPTVMGIAVKVASRMAVPAANTITCTLRNSTDGLDVDSVTLNVSDIDNGAGWYVLDFGGTSALTDGKNYIVRCIATAAAAVTFSRSTTGTTNFSKLIITSTTGAPAATDQLHIGALWTAAATKTDVAVTMDNNTADSFGPTVSGGPPQGMTINKGGTLVWKVDGNTQFLMKGVLRVNSGGTMNIGTSGIPIGAFTALYQMDSVANVDSGLIVDSGATFTAYGPTKTVLWTLLTTDAAALDDHIHVTSTTGWAVGDVVAIASTSQTSTQHEVLTILTVDSPTQVTFTGTVVNAHSGTTPTQAEVINLTRSLLIRGASASLQGFVEVLPSGSFATNYAELKWMGSATVGKRGLQVGRTASYTGTLLMDHSSLNNWVVASSNVLIGDIPAKANVTLQNTSVYAVHTGLSEASTSRGTFTNLIIMGSTATNNVFFSGPDNDVSTIVSTSNAGAIAMQFQFYTGTIATLTLHSNAGHLFIGQGTADVTVNTLTTWRNASANGALQFNDDNKVHTFNSYTAFGNVAANVYMSASITVVLNSFVSNGDTTFATTNGIQFASANTNFAVILNSGSMSQVAGIKTAHTNDLSSVANVSLVVVRAYNTLFKTFTWPNLTSSYANLFSIVPSGLFSTRHNGTAGDNRRWVIFGRARTDTGIFQAASPSERVIPTSASSKLPSGVSQQAVANGATATFSAWVRKSVVADGGTDPAAANYNGNEPRLILRANPAVGIAADVVLDTMTVAIGNWELLTGVSAAVTDDAILTAYVDCDGTAGWINVDDWNGASTGANWVDGYPVILGATGGAGGPKASPVMF